MSPEKAADTAEDRTQPAEKVEEEQAVDTPEPKEQEEGEKESDESASKSPEPTSPSSASASTSAPPAPAQSGAQAQWQAVWAPQYNAYYFYNPVTQETTWTNPLQPEAYSSYPAASGSGSAVDAASSSTSSFGSTPAPASAEDATAEAGSSSGTPQAQMSAAAAHYAALQAAAIAQGIDPLLAHLDPSLVSSVAPGSSGVPGDVPVFKAQFNAHTGRFAPADSRTPGHLSEYERAKRMSEFYFDVNKWEEDLARRGGRLMGEEGEEGGEGTSKKRKKPTKKDIERFKEQKRLKKIAKTAWLRT